MKNYKLLKELDYDLHIETIQKADVLSIRNNLSIEQGYNLEKTLIEFILKLRNDKYI